VIYVTAWGVSWGAGITVYGGQQLVDASATAAHVMSFWMGLVRVVAASFIYTYFLTVATIVYFLLRQEVDGTETDEVFVEEQADKFGLPAVAPDAAGVPVVAEDEILENGAEAPLS